MDTNPFGPEFIKAWEEAIRESMRAEDAVWSNLWAAGCAAKPPRKRKPRPRLTKQDKFDIDVLLFDCEVTVRKGDRR